MRQIATFPGVILVSVKEKFNGANYMLVHRNEQDALRQSDPIIVGVYKFVEARSIELGTPVSTKRRSRKTS